MRSTIMRMESQAESLDGVLKLLRFRNRRDLAQMLERAWLELDESDQYGSYLFSTLTTARIHAPIADYAQLRSLQEADKNEILQTLLEVYPPRDHSIEIAGVEFVVDTSAPSDRESELISEIEAQRSIMIAVSTGGPRIQSVDREYQERRVSIQSALRDLGLDDPNPFGDLWTWYGKWSSGDLPSYQSRRQFVTELYNPLIERLKRGTRSQASGIFKEPTGWTKVDRTVSEIRQRLEKASNEEQFQAVGLLCREALISLAQTVFDPNRHPVLDGVAVSPTDGKRILEAYLAVELAGGENKIARQHAKAALDLANELQHKRTAVFRQAALCSEATAAVVNLIAIVSGRRDP
jgi:hypothetical protein